MKRVLDHEHDPSDVEPMEVGAVVTVPISHPTSDPALLVMQRSMEGLHKELAKLKANTIYVADPRPAAKTVPAQKTYTRAATPLMATPEAHSLLIRWVDPLLQRINCPSAMNVSRWVILLKVARSEGPGWPMWQ
jgi:hypothetical protein